jgi:hypothetical protein
MDPRTGAERAPTPEAIEFVRFCYGRRRVGWPELYDEMCAVAGRGLFRGWGSEELASLGIGFGLFELPSLAAVVSMVVAEEQQRRGRATGPDVERARAAAAAEPRAAERGDSPDEGIPAGLMYAGAGGT